MCHTWRISAGNLRSLRRGGALKDFLEYGCGIGGVATKKIQDLEDLMRRQPVDRKRGPIDGEMSKLLVYGVNKCMGRKLKLGK